MKGFQKGIVLIYFDHIFLNKFTHTKLKITITDIETKNYVSEKSNKKVKNDTTQNLSIKYSFSTYKNTRKVAFFPLLSFFFFP